MSKHDKYKFKFYSVLFRLFLCIKYLCNIEKIGMSYINHEIIIEWFQSLKNNFKSLSFQFRHSKCSKDEGGRCIELKHLSKHLKSDME